MFQKLAKIWKTLKKYPGTQLVFPGKNQITKVLMQFYGKKSLKGNTAQNPTKSLLV